MSDNSTEYTFDVIEVPPELRGLSDEEIIKNSEKPLREVSGKRKNGAKRPAKKVRVALKMQKELEDIRLAAAQLFEKTFDKKIADINFYNSSHAKSDMQIAAYSKKSKDYSFYDVDVQQNRNPKKNEGKFTAIFSETTKPATTEGRVLKASFGSITKRVLEKK
ncbi:MAG: hypothetical protein MJZ05_00195 [Fibrobacter sp.]|nr:hypothetical protein [Fibrobacter sp.]